MNTIKRIIKNTGILGFTNLLDKAFLFFITIFTARILGTVDFGKFSLAIAFSMIAFRVTEFGLNTILKREVARNKKITEKYLSNAFTIRIFSSFLTILSVILLVFLIGYPQSTSLAVILYSLSAAFVSLSKLFISIFQANEKMEFQAITFLIPNTIRIGLVLFFLFSGYGLIEVISSFLIASIIQFFLSYSITTKKFSKIKISINKKFWKKLIKTSYPLAFAGIFAMIYFRIDTLMLSLLKGEEAVGIYNAAYNILMGLTIIPSSFLPAVFPNLSRFYKESKTKLKKGFKKSLLLMAISGLSIAIIGTFFAKNIISIIYGTSYLESVLPLQILFFALLFLFMNNTTGIMINSIDKQKVNMFIGLSSVIFNITLNYFLIIKFSFVGASVATLLTEFFVFLSKFYYIKMKT